MANIEYKIVDNCYTCAFCDQTAELCKLLRAKIKPQEDFCSKHKTLENLTHCGYCNTPLITAQFYNYDEKTHLSIPICFECVRTTGTCRMCTKSCRCEFEENPSSIPKVVRQRVQNGGMVMETDIKNPTRIELFCRGCECFDGQECMREYGTCSKYELRDTVTSDLSNIEEV